MKRQLLYFVCVVLCASCSEIRIHTYLVDYMSPLQGTMSDNTFLTGNTYVAIALSRNMNLWTPQIAKMGDGWTYAYDGNKIIGIKLRRALPGSSDNLKNNWHWRLSRPD